MNKTQLSSFVLGLEKASTCEVNREYNLDIAYSTNLIFGKVTSLFYDRGYRNDKGKRDLFMYLLDLDLMLRKELIHFVENPHFSELRAVRMKEMLDEMIRINKIILENRNENKQRKTS